MSSAAAEGIRETASNLLRIANRLDGIDESADAMRSTPQCPTCGIDRYPVASTIFDPPGEPCIDQWHLRNQGGTARVADGDGAEVEREQAEPKRSDFLVGADRDGAVSLRCVQLDGWCGWTHEPESNEYSLPELEQIAAEHQKEHDGATSNTEQECSTAYVPPGFGALQGMDSVTTLTCLRRPCRWEQKVWSTDGIAELFAEHNEREHNGA